MKKILVVTLCMLGLALGITNAQAAPVDVSSTSSTQSISPDRTAVSTPSATTTSTSTANKATSGTTTGATSKVTGTTGTKGATTKVPEPATMLLLGLGFLGLAGIKRKIKR